MHSPYPPYTRNPYTIRANPLLETYQVMFVLWFIVIGFFLVFIIAGIIFSIIARPEASRLLPSLFMYGLIVLCFCFSFITSILQRRYWKRIEQRRFAAAGGNPSLLASEQPVVNTVALQLPCKIEVRMGNGAIVLFIAMILVFALIFSAVYSWVIDGFLSFSPDRFHNFLELFAIFGSSMVVVLLVLFFSPIGLGRQSVEITEQGIKSRYGGKKSAMRWEEVRLFAMYNTWGVQKNSSSLTFELSSATDIVRWAWVLHTKPLQLGMIPTVSFEEYTRQMQALNALSVARTGLPLYDLRKEPATGVPGSLPETSFSNS